MPSPAPAASTTAGPEASGPGAPADREPERSGTGGPGATGLASAAGLGGLGGGVVGAVNWVTQRRRRRQESAAPAQGPTEATTTEVPAPDLATPTAGAASTPPITEARSPEAPTTRTPATDTPAGEGGTSSRGVAGAAAGVAAASAVAASSTTSTTAPDRARPEPVEPAREEPAREEPPLEEPAREEPSREEPPLEEPAREEPSRDDIASTTATPAPAASAGTEAEPSVGPTVPSTPAHDPAAAEADAAWSARRERAKRRKRILLIVLAAVVAVLLVWAIPWLVSSIGSLFPGEPERPAVITPAAPPPKPELPRGGTTIFPNYRVVAYYGTPGNPSMGVLGDGPPEPMAQQLEKAALAFTTPNRAVQPTMELIVHVADGAPGDDGDYSHAIDEQKAWQYLAVARAHRQLLVIDIQPGSSDFLSTTKPWERLLREPDVGLALDPEWRMPPGQVPGKSIGTVTSTEVNETAQWLAGIVREANLPQKLFVVHQFTPNMITEPEKLITPPELAVVGHVDGFGGPADKLAKYGALVRPRQLHPGFKLFYTQDTPMLSPEQTLGLNPAPDFVTYQ